MNADERRERLRARLMAQMSPEARARAEKRWAEGEEAIEEFKRSGDRIVQEFRDDMKALFKRLDEKP